MRKSPLILLPLILIGLTGVYALVDNLLPDTSEFPRVPTADGTIWGYITRILGVTDLANYLDNGGDGTVENTLALSGTTATGFLSTKTCNGSQVWGTLANGTPTCRNKDGVIAYLGTGTILAWWVMAYRADGSSIPLHENDPILEWDIIKTDVWAGITITFVDGSLLRIDADSTVSLDIGTTYDGQSIAYAILENGWLWWRVLTETGWYYIGNKDVIAWVRGTSVSLTSKYTSPISLWWSGDTNRWEIATTGKPHGFLNIVHSRIGWENDNGEGTRDSVGTIICGGKTYQIEKLASIYISGWGVDCDALVISYKDGVKSFYSDGTYGATISANTIADLNYMSWRLMAGWLTPSQREVFMSEFRETQPEWTEEKNAICTPPWLQTKTYWDSFIGRDQTIFPVCQDSSILAYANYGNIASEYKNLYQSTSSIFGSGNIDGANKPRIVYSWSTLNSILSNNWAMTLNITTPTTNPSISYILGLSGSNSYLNIYQSGPKIKIISSIYSASLDVLPGNLYPLTINHTNKTYTISIPWSSTGITLTTDVW
jgi:hypothetical protein